MKTILLFRETEEQKQDTEEHGTRILNEEGREEVFNLQYARKK